MSLLNLKTINPATGKELNEYPIHTPSQVEKILEDAERAFRSWRNTPMDGRSQLMQQVAHLLRVREEECATMITMEMGKPIASARSEVQKCAWVCEYYGDHASEFLDQRRVETDLRESFVSYSPIGAVLAIMPWNFPFWQVFRFAAPTLMAGNVGLLKHAPNVPGCALLIVQLFKEAGFPDGVFSNLIIPTAMVSDIISHRSVRAVTLTGSGPAGSAVAAAAGRSIKPCLLELGGSDPYLILEDANVDLAAEKCCKARLLNAGQSCISAKRFIVMDQVYDDFLGSFTEWMSQAVLGNPLDTVDLGPIARQDLREKVHHQVMQSVERGATLELGGHMVAGDGYYYPPSILSNVAPDMPAYSEEIFGPVASLIRVRDEGEAIRIANDTSFGLGAAIFTQDIDRGRRLAKFELEAGCCTVNDFVRSDPRLPFGGIKSSGFGRELGVEGIRAFVNVKTICVA